MTPPTAPDPRDRTSSDPIARVQRELLTLGRRGTARVRREDEVLSVVDRSLLTYIQDNPGCRAVDIAAHFQLNRSTVSRQLAALLEHGYVAADDDAPGGSRGIALRLTPAGGRAFDQSTRTVLDSVARRLEGWSETDLEAFARMLERYNAAPDE
ncbi:MarR family winged helix-turn-helix transcriptional regulator [Leifsonia shinshuensis]|uniref:DNA-binding MarR family transcriptional regulator n=1 Tax=Leifsonia shinshuensis TaxID=150026 RepID=A0A853CVL6_9MICO|nr:MarR family winged helix-turn-helix transcriptional regulator [Leifsonia shinshuensis]NYJ24468.1 DNA-binding MarR family transcriptional regulator [Leifsonia shinshuensis]